MNVFNIRTIFLGGNDGTIRYWQMNSSITSSDYIVRTIRIGDDEGKPGGGKRGLGSDKIILGDEYNESYGSYGTVNIPREKQVSSLYCSDEFLLAGDDSGELRLWLIVYEQSPHFRNDESLTEPNGIEFPGEILMTYGLCDAIRNYGYFF